MLRGGHVGTNGEALRVLEERLRALPAFGALQEVCSARADDGRPRGARRGGWGAGSRVDPSPVSHPLYFILSTRLGGWLPCRTLPCKSRLMACMTRVPRPLGPAEAVPMRRSARAAREGARGRERCGGCGQVVRVDPQIMLVLNTEAMRFEDQKSGQV